MDITVGDRWLTVGEAGGDGGYQVEPLCVCGEADYFKNVKE